MKWIRLALSLAIFVPGISVLGGLATFDSGAEPWLGLATGATIGLLFGLVFGGVRGAWQDVFFGPLEREPAIGADND